MKDILGKEIKVGDKVVFPGPYGRTLSIGNVTKVGLRRRYGTTFQAIKVALDFEDSNRKTVRDYWGNRVQEGNLPTEGVLVIRK